MTKKNDIKQQVKICPACARPFTNRKKWESRGLWPEIVYCSTGCSTHHKKRV